MPTKEKHNIQVYDNDGETLDRYTVIINNDVYSMCHNPRSPVGVNQYLGDTSEFSLPKSRLLNKSEISGELCDAINERCGITVPY